MPKEEVEENFSPPFSKLKENTGNGGDKTLGNIHSFEPSNKRRKRKDEENPR